MTKRAERCVDDASDTAYRQESRAGKFDQANGRFGKGRNLQQGWRL